MPEPVVWFELVGQHGDTLRGFYRELLGWEFDTSVAPSSPAAPVPSGRRRGRRAVPFRRSLGPPAEPPWWVTFYTRVADLDAAIARARALGSRLLVGPLQHGDVRLAVVTDPAGHPVGLFA